VGVVSAGPKPDGCGLQLPTNQNLYSRIRLITLLTQVGLVSAHIVLDGDPASPPQRGRAPNFRPISLVAKPLMHQDATYYGGRPQPRALYVRWGPGHPSPRRGGAPSLIFGPCLLPPNGRIDQDETWSGGRPRPRPHCVRWGPSFRPLKRDTSPNF